MKKPRRLLSIERRILLMALLSGLPAIVIALAALQQWTAPADVTWPLAALVVGVWIGAAWAVRGYVAYPLRTLANLLAAIREGDYSLRVRASDDDSFSEALREANRLTEALRSQRIGAVEAAALLHKVMDEIDAAVFAFDDEDRLRLVNRAGERLLGEPPAHLIGRSAAELGLAEHLHAETGRTFEKAFPGTAGRWTARRAGFRDLGRPHQLLVLSDLTRELREEELDAWQRLVRVLSHELNNSLAPIHSIAGSLADRIRRQESNDSSSEMLEGLAVIERRADSLSRFLSSYARLARLPEPKLESIDLAALVERTAALETRLPVDVIPGPDATVQADPAQLEQALINLVRNAVDASVETNGAVRLSWSAARGVVEIRVEDEGPGLADNANLFVPFYTTKPSGSGVGLVLARKIAERHGGSLRLENRDECGCAATLALPLR